MPNWCNTIYKFRGDRNELETLYNNIKDWTSRSLAENGFGNNWLGNIIHGAGLADRIDNPDKNLRLECRGRLIDFGPIETDNDNNSYINAQTETAYFPMAKMWNAVTEKLGLKTINFTFMAEEPGDELYWIYDPNNYNDFDDSKVYIDACGNEETDDIYGYYDKSTAISRLNEFFETNYENLNDFIPLCAKYEEDHDDEGAIFQIHEFEIDNVLQD